MDPERWYAPRPDPEGLTRDELAARRRYHGQLSGEDGPGPLLLALVAGPVVLVGIVVLYFALPMMLAMLLPG